MLTVSTGVLAIITASPLVWMLSASVKEPGEIFNLSLIPQHGSKGKGGMATEGLGNSLQYRIVARRCEPGRRI